MVTEAGSRPGTPMIELAGEISEVLMGVEEAAAKFYAAHNIGVGTQVEEILGYPMAPSPTEEGLVDTRVEKSILIRPELIAQALPISSKSARTTLDARMARQRILTGADDRVIANIGPCSIHDADQAVEFARKVILPARAVFSDTLEIGMRFYDEKPRTGPKKGKIESWKGLFHDPLLNRTDNINLGLTVSRLAVCRITDMGGPVVKERLNAQTPQYQNGLVAEDVIGARNTTDPKTREYGAGTSSPIGWKNTLDGDIEAAVAAAAGARHEHAFIGLDMSGRLARIQASGNPYGYVILRGTNEGPNFDQDTVQRTLSLQREYGTLAAVGVDFSHQNSGKKADKQIVAAKAVSQQIAAGETGIKSIWTESNLVRGRQDLDPDHPDTLEYGVSITDECIDPDETFEILNMVSSAVKQRRRVGYNLRQPSNS